jgi:hypothetical protein
VVRVANVNVAAGNSRALRLRVAAEAEIGITFDEHLQVDRAMRAVASDATFTQRVVLEDKWPGLVSMALRATLIPPRHGQPPGRFHDVHAVRIVALDAVHPPFQDRVVLGEVELSLHLQVALKTSGRVLARIDDESFAPAQAGRGDMLAARTVAGFAPALAGHRRILGMNPRVRAGWKSPHNLGMTIRAGLVADEMRAGDFQRRHDLGRTRGTRHQQQRG